MPGPNPFKVLQRALKQQAAENKRNATAAAGAVRKLIKDQFARGVDPSGKKQPATVRGKDALVSTKLQNAIKITAVPGAVVGVGELKSSRQWLDAHQEGHEFPARRSTGNRIAFNRDGKRVSIAKLKRAASPPPKTTTKKSWFGLRSKTTTKQTAAAMRVDSGRREAYWRILKSGRGVLRGRITNAKAHTVGARVLPQRLIYPESALGPRWANEIKASIALELWKLDEKVRKG